MMSSIKPGTRFTQNKITVVVELVKGGEVYLRRWPAGITRQPFFANCFRLPVEKFMQEVQHATQEDA